MRLDLAIKLLPVPVDVQLTALLNIKQFPSITHTLPPIVTELNLNLLHIKLLY
jgi:hypothetical protein